MYVMIAVKQNKKNADSGWQQEKAVFGESIRLEKPPAITHTKLVQCLFIIAVQWCEVDIR
jgi:hypothetical protein